MITLTLKNFSDEHELWLAKNIGPRMHYLHNSRGGQGWIAKSTLQQIETNGYINVWKLTLEDERHATYFRLMFPE